MNPVEWLESLPQPPEWTLDRTRRLFSLAGVSTNALKVIHVAGTNGKGSTVALIASGLQAAGFKTAAYYSPHVLDFRERIQVNGEWISEEKLNALTEVIKPLVKQMLDDGNSPSFFEVVTAIAVKHFINEQVDWAVVETGLGGRLDATNVLESECAVITPISLEHTEKLGKTIDAIATEKAGIVKLNKPVFTNNTDEKAVNAIKQTASKLNAQVTVTEPLTNVNCSDTVTSFTYAGRQHSTSLLGPHQALNASLAIEVLNWLGVSQEDIAAGLKTAFVPARLEIVKRSPLVVVDGAHNPAGTRTLVEAIRTIWPHKKIALVFGVLADKDYAEMANELRRLQVQTVNVTKPKNERALPLEKAKQLFEGFAVTAFEEPENALEDAVKKAAELNAIVLCCGSLYLAGELLAGTGLTQAKTL
ncbi:MAG: folylpolyglutamate synthase/dihydrofolate synthase family protein [Candidatus Micrarchaeota archaeon]